MFAQMQGKQAQPAARYFCPSLMTTEQCKFGENILQNFPLLPPIQQIWYNSVLAIDFNFTKKVCYFYRPNYSGPKITIFPH